MKYSTLWGLSAWLHTKNPILKSHFYRHRSLLRQKCSLFLGIHFMTSHPARLLCQELSKYAPLEPADLTDQKMANLLRDWNKDFPRDRHFYRMALLQFNLWEAFASKAIEEFIHSKEGERWFQARSRLQKIRKPLFELDIPYYGSDAAAIAYETGVKSMIRSAPLLTYKDLRSIGVKNAQAIYERFPHRAVYRERFLSSLSSNSKFLG